MKRIMLDTNIYGDVIERGDAGIIRSLVERRMTKNLVVYGSSVIRRELRQIPKGSDAPRRLRLAVLSLYDLLVGSRSFELGDDMYELANSYVNAYKELKGELSVETFSHEKLHNDFLIIATASLKNLDIVYSSDVKTMLSEAAVKAYRIINGVKKLRTPNFETYEEFMKELKRCEI